MTKTFFILVCGFMMCAAKMTLQAQNKNTVVQSSVNEKRISIITHHTKFTNTKLEPYWISYKDGNLYMKKVVGRNSKNELILKNVKSIYGNSQSGGTCFAIQNNGSLWAWGNNEKGQVGDNTGINRDVPVKILDNVKDVTIGGQYKNGGYISALKNDGTVYAWGGLHYEEKENCIFTPQKLPLENVSYVYYDGRYIYAVTSSCDIYQWSMNKNIQPIKGKFNHTLDVGNDWKLRPNGKLYDKYTNLFASNVVFAQISAFRTDPFFDRKDEFGAYITSNGDLYLWGDVTDNGIKKPQKDPVLVLQNVIQVCYAFSGKSHYALCADGNLYKVHFEKTFKHVLVASNVHSINKFGNDIYYYTNDGCIYQCSSGSKPIKTYSDIALPQIKFDDVDIVMCFNQNSINFIENNVLVSIIICALIISVLILLYIKFPKSRKIIWVFFGIIAVITLIVTAIPVILKIIETIKEAFMVMFGLIIFIIFLLRGGLRRVGKDMFK